MAPPRQTDLPLYHFDDVVIDRQSFGIEKGDQKMSLPQRTFDLLVYLIEHRNRVIEKQELFEQMLNAYVRYPAWSPLGNQIVYEYAETTGNIWMMELR